MFSRYIYKVTYLPTGQFYIGKRKSKEGCTPEEDFGIYYFTSACSIKNKWIINSLKKDRHLWKIEFLHRDVESSEKLSELEIKELKSSFQGIRCINPLCLNKCNPVFSSNVDMTGYKHSEEYKQYMRNINLRERNPFYGKKHSEESRRRIGEKSKGRKKTEEERKKLSDAMKKNNPMHNPEVRKNHYMATHNPEYRRMKSEMCKGKNNPNYGNHWSDEMKKKLSEKKKGLKAYNNGEICIMARECPEGFVLGYLRNKKN